MEINPHDMRSLAQLALREDVGDGDHSSLASVPIDAYNRARLLVKETGIVAGVAVAYAVFDLVDPTLSVNVNISDGSQIKVGDIVLTVEGNARSILKAERLVLNIIQRMSGIATQTHRFVNLLAGLPVKVLDTRKTTPNFRLFEKMAVEIGGGVNHRMGLYDMVMLKDNHVDYAGGIENALVATNRYLAHKEKPLRIEIETRNLKEVEEVLRVAELPDGHLDIIMLDNFKVPDLRKAVALINGRFETEASGNINEKTIREVAETGVNGISIGALTHQIKSLDLSLKAF